jgi:tetratricopeptide (TPR) repeat protein
VLHKARNDRKDQGSLLMPGDFSSRLSRYAYRCALFLGLGVLRAIPLSAQMSLASPSVEWLADLRKEVAAEQWTEALQVADRRLAAAPEDTDARGWRARIQARLGRTQEAELEFRAVLAKTPNDPDVLSGLAGVLARGQHPEEALSLLNRAHKLDPERGDLLRQRGALLRMLRRPAEARLDFRAALAKDPGDQEARAGLDSLAPEPRHEFRIGSDTDTFNYTGTANSETLGLVSRWNTRWTTTFSGIVYQRFGFGAARFVGSVSRRLGRNDSLGIGGGASRDQGVIPRGELFVAYGHGLRLSQTGFIRGLELDLQPHSFWYRDAQVFALGVTALFYLPRDWGFLIGVTPARSSFPGTSAEWRPSGIAKLTFPVHRRVTANVFFAAGTENFAQADQIGRFSARSFGGGTKYQFSRRQDITFYVAHQNRSQGRTQTSFGVSYAYRF